jgi:hypothetical protein
MQKTNRSLVERSPEESWIQRAELERRTAGDAGRKRTELAAELGSEDAATLDALIAVGIDRENLPAVEWIPMVLVAWADGLVQSGEREAILRATGGDGIPPDHPAHAILIGWLETPPTPKLLGAWQAYLTAMSRGEHAGSLPTREAWVRARAREVAEADGGWLGFAKVSSEEGGMMLELARAFRTAQRA